MVSVRECGRHMYAHAHTSARKIDPLGVSKLVAHKGEIALTAQRARDQTNDLVQRHAAVDDGCQRPCERHVVVHLLVLCK